MMSMQEKIDYGIELYREQRRLDAELKKIKLAVREHAEKMRVDGESKVELVGAAGTIEVTFPTDDYRVSAKNSALVFELKDQLGERFDDIFDGRVSYKVHDEFMLAVDDLPSEKQVAVLELISVSTPTPRVKFPK